MCVVGVCVSVFSCILCDKCCMELYVFLVRVVLLLEIACTVIFVLYVCLCDVCHPM